MPEYAEPEIGADGWLKQKKPVNWTRILLIAGAVILLAIIANTVATGPQDVAGADIEVTGLGVTIYNNSSEAWQNICLEINSGAYTCRVRQLDAGSSYYVGLLNFADKNGQVFNPLTHKVTRFAIRIYAEPWPGEGTTHRFSSWTIT